MKLQGVRCVLFDTVAGKLEGGCYFPKDSSRNSWETRTREFYNETAQKRELSVTHILSKPEARIALFADGQVLHVESSLPKLLHGQNLIPLTDAAPALEKLGQFLADYVEGLDVPVAEMESLRVDYVHNFQVGELLPDYVHTLSKISALKHRALLDGYDGVEWWNLNGRRIRAYDKYHEILEKDKKKVPEARGVLRIEVEIRKKSGYLQRRTNQKYLSLQDVLNPVRAYVTLAETFNKMCFDSRFLPLDSARALLDEHFRIHKANRLLGVLQRMKSQDMDKVKLLSPRSTYFSDKSELRRLGLWPPASGDDELPPLELPPLEALLHTNKSQNGENQCVDSAKYN
jgi:hypothetical protein